MHKSCHSRRRFSMYWIGSVRWNTINFCHSEDQPPKLPLCIGLSISDHALETPTVLYRSIANVLQFANQISYLPRSKAHLKHSPSNRKQAMQNLLCILNTFQEGNPAMEPHSIRCHARTACTHTRTNTDTSMYALQESNTSTYHGLYLQWNNIPLTVNYTKLRIDK